MAGQRGFFDTDEWLQWLSQAGDPLDRLATVVAFQLFNLLRRPRVASISTPGTGRAALVFL